MKNIDLLYKSKKVTKLKKLKGKKYHNIHIKDENITSKTLNYIMEQIDSIKHYRYINLELMFTFENFSFADKIVYLILELIICDLAKNTNFTIIFNIKHDSHNLYASGIVYSPLYTTLRKHGSYLNKKYFLSLFKKLSINKENFRRFISKEELENNEMPSKIYGDLATALKFCSNDEEWIDAISEVVSELVCNVESHAKDSDCLVDVNFSNSITKDGDDKHYESINISIINLSNSLLFDQIKYNIKEKKYKQSDDVYKQIYTAYNNHKKFFSDEYNEDDFFFITAFQNHVSTRNTRSSKSGGTGLTTLIQNITAKSQVDFSYVLTGENILFLNSEYLNIKDGKFIGFNIENDYINSQPEKKSIARSALFVPGTVYNLFLIKEV